MSLGTRSGTGKHWIVFSDRANNKTYKDADITSNLKISNIKFMEKFFVIDEDGKFVKIAQGTSETDGGIKVGNVYGWIPKENLLTGKDNEIQYFDKIADELIRYNRIKSFIS